MYYSNMLLQCCFLLLSREWLLSAEFCKRAHAKSTIREAPQRDQLHHFQLPGVCPALTTNQYQLAIEYVQQRTCRPMYPHSVSEQFTYQRHRYQLVMV
jgi:hypothetical protein